MRSSIAQRGNIQFQVDYATAWNQAIYRIGCEGIMVMLLHGPLQQFNQADLRQHLKGLPEVFAYNFCRIQAQDVPCSIIECCNYASRVSGDKAVGNRSENVVHVLLVFVDLTEEPGVVDSNSGWSAEAE